MRFMTAAGLTVAAMAAALSPAVADPAQPLAHGGAAPAHAPLKPGKAAGIHPAQEIRGGLLLLGAGGVAIGIAIVAASAGGGSGNGGQISPQMNSITTGTP
ncbi:MAG TPA: hypothetical protein VGC16_06065 [Rhizomicrobium sp.]